MIKPKDSKFAIDGFRIMSESLERSNDAGSIDHISSAIADSVASLEDDALGRAVRRHFGVEDVLDVVGVVSCITYNHKPDRRYISLIDGADIITFFGFSLTHEGGKISAILDYLTFDGKK